MFVIREERLWYSTDDAVRQHTRSALTRLETNSSIKACYWKRKRLTVGCTPAT